MLNINPYLNFPGTTEEAMNFYRSIFGGEFNSFQRFNDSPGFEKMPKNEQTKIMHISLPMGKGNFLMATDTLESMGMTFTPGNNAYISINTESEEEATKFFNGLAVGGQIEMPLNNTFWGAYCGMCVDKYSVKWMINYEAKPNNWNK